MDHPRREGVVGDGAPGVEFPATNPRVDHLDDGDHRPRRREGVDGCHRRVERGVESDGEFRFDLRVDQIVVQSPLRPDRVREDASVGGFLDAEFLPNRRRREAHLVADRWSLGVAAVDQRLLNRVAVGDRQRFGERVDSFASPVGFVQPVPESGDRRGVDSPWHRPTLRAGRAKLRGRSTVVRPFGSLLRSPPGFRVWFGPSESGATDERRPT
ncbi:hypothetical protein ACFQL0_16725 [Haloplanus litoreus]|uniref:hypothetical protein n=1 Tax=Haloplanus litoreus TaxID=767515 RepID=UPI00360C5F38